MRLENILNEVISMVRPREKLTVAEWAQKYRYIDRPGFHRGFWSAEKTPYLLEPMSILASLDFIGMVFAGPARTGKSEMWWNWVGYSADVDPADMIFYGMTDSRALEVGKADWRKFVSMKRPDEDVSVIQRLLATGKQNVKDKRFSNGMEVMFRGPSLTELSGKTLPRVWEEDYDRVNVPGPGPDDIDQQGSYFDLGSKRTGTYKRYGMTVAESSPGFEVTERNWIASTPHMAPPTKGILSLYNKGDRRRWYWMCPDCDEPFEPTFSLLNFPEDGDNLERAEQTVMVCPHCGCVHGPEKKGAMNSAGRWLIEGQTWDGKTDTISGRARRSNIASFWMQGPAAGFQDWQNLVKNYLDAVDTMRTTGSMGALKKFQNTDLGVPFQAPEDENARLPEVLKSRAEEWGDGGCDYDSRNCTVPPWVRFLVATVDIAVRSFVVQVTGIGEHGEMTIIDAFKIRTSNRVDENDARKPLLPVDPAAYPEDWDLLVDHVIEKSYPLSDGSGRRMPIKITFSDSGGRDGFTAKAVLFWMRLRDDPLKRQHHTRFHLIKGLSTTDKSGGGVAMWTRKTAYYDAAAVTNTRAAMMGKVPYQQLNSNELKDRLNSALMREESGAPRVRFPIWLPDWAYKQLCAEERVSGKGWQQKGKNETWDLSAYAIGACQHPDIKIDTIKWDLPEKVPTWARPWDENDFLIMPDKKQSFVKRRDDGKSLADAAAKWV